MENNFHDRLPQELHEDNSQHNQNVQCPLLKHQDTVCLHQWQLRLWRTPLPQSIPSCLHHFLGCLGLSLYCTILHSSFLDHTVNWNNSLSIFNIIILSLAQFSGLDLCRWSHMRCVHEWWQGRTKRPQMGRGGKESTKCSWKKKIIK